MPLVKSFDYKGATHASAYAKVVSVSMDPEARSARAKVKVFVDEAAYNAGEECLVCYSYAFNGADYDTLFGTANLETAGKEPIGVVEDEIKTYPEWLGATQV